MPASVLDRMANKYEPILFFAKSQKYYTNIDPIREPCETYEPFNVRVRDSDRPGAQSKLIHASEEEQKFYKNFVRPDPHTLHTNRLKRYNNNELGIRNGLGKSAFNKPSHKGKNPGDIWQINTRPYPDAHFATFPIDIPKRIISIATKPGDTVLDPFLGSGTTALAAEKLNRQWVGIELNPEYVELARKRLAPHLSKKLEAYQK